MSLFSLIFIIFYYLINKINKRYDCFTDSSSSSDINQAIITAVNNKYRADVEAIRNLSSIARELHSTNNFTVPANLTVAGKIYTTGKTNFPDGWTGGVRTFDLYASGTIGLGGDDAKCKTIIHQGGINTNGLVVTGDSTINGNSTINGYIHVKHGYRIQIGDSPDGISNTITDGAWNGAENSLCIVGKGSTPNRSIYMWDNVTTIGSHTVNSTLTVQGATIFKGGNNKNTTSVTGPTHLPFTNGTNYITGNTIFRDGNVSFSDTSSINTNGQINTMGRTNYPEGWDGGVRTWDLYASATIAVGNNECTVINSTMNNQGFWTKYNLGVDGEANFTGASGNNSDGHRTYLPYKKDGINYIRGNTTLNGDVYIGPITTTSGGGNLTVQGRSYLNTVQIGGSDTTGVSNTITDGTHDATALCIVGKGNSPNRFIRMWDNVKVDGSLQTGAIKLYGNIIETQNNLHLYAPNSNDGLGDIYFICKKNTVVSTAWGGSGNLIVENNLTVQGGTTFNGATTFKGGKNKDVAGTSPTHFPYTDGTNFITGNTIFREGNVTFFEGLQIGSWRIYEDNGKLVFMKNNRGIVMDSEGDSVKRLRPIGGDTNGNVNSASHWFRVQW